MLTRWVPTEMLNAAAASTLKAPPASDTAMIQEKVLTAFGSMKSRGLYAVVRQPDQRCLTTGDAVATVGEETFRLADGTPLATENGDDTGPSQATTGQPVDIGQPLAGRLWREELARPRVVRQERGAHLVTDFESLRADGRPQPGKQFAGRHGHPGDGRFEHAGQQAAPSGMGGGDNAAGPVAQENRSEEHTSE